MNIVIAPTLLSDSLNVRYPLIVSDQHKLARKGYDLCQSEKSSLRSINRSLGCPGEPDEAIYEAAHAFDTPEDLLRRLSS
jgi:hypothetical protein